MYNLTDTQYFNFINLQKLKTFLFVCSTVVRILHFDKVSQRQLWPYLASENVQTNCQNHNLQKKKKIVL